jgi:hypothetical protein
VKITVKVKTTQRVVIDRIKQSIAEFFNKRFSRKNSAIREKVKVLIYNWVKQQPEMQDLLNGKYGKLGPQFGIPDGENASIVNTICKAASEAFVIEVNSVNKNLVGGIYLNFISSDFEKFLSIPEGHVYTEQGGDLHWLDWLLTKGYSTVITGYSFLLKVDAPGSRSKGGLMIERGVWRVPPEFAGTAENNFITRAITSPGNEIELKRILEEYLN